MWDKTYIIAEAGVNHNGSIEIALQLIDAAAWAGADAVKFQTFSADKLVIRKAQKAEYQLNTTDNAESQFEMLKKLELSMSDHFILLEHCRKKGIQFLSTPFDLASADFLISKCNMPYMKVPSGEITNAPLLLEVANTGIPVILSTGMSTLGEIEPALGVLAFGYTKPQNTECSRQAFQEAFYSDIGQAVLRSKVVLLHCTTEYPAPFSEVNLNVMDNLRSAFGLKVGYSDHTSGIAVPIAAVAKGAALIEKHFTLDCNMSGPDHRASLEPEQLATMISSIRQVEEALGSSLKIPTLSEQKNISVVRKSLVTTKPVQPGEVFSSENLGTKRPGTGVSPMLYWEWIGKKAERAYEQDEVIAP